MVPECITNLSNLVYLDLHESSRIQELPESIGEMGSLMHVDLSGCYSIERLPVSFGNLEKLVHLDLSGCFSISGLSESLPKLSNLEYLYLRFNHKLCTIPETIGNLTKLNTLDLSFCRNLQRLPASLSAMNSLKFLHVSGCSKLEKSTLSFVVHAADGESSSNLSELEDKHPNFLEVSRLENVKSSEEAKRIKLVEKQSTEKLELAWTRDAKIFVDDSAVLRRLEPLEILESLTLKGYNGIRFPSWMMSVATYLPHLKVLVMEDLPSCNILPPLGQLPNLQWLDIGGMDRIRKIDGDFYGGKRAFPRLEHFSLSRMACLEEWNAAYCIGEDGLNELAFPELSYISIDRCPLLRLKACLPRCKHSLSINRSDKVLLSSWEDRGHVRSAATTWLFVSYCEAPLHQWSLLRHLPCLTHIRITNCSDLTCSLTDLLRCISSLKTLIVEGRDSKNTIAALPERLGDLTSLTELHIVNCKGIKALPDSMRQLSCLQHLYIDGCPELVQWCESEENGMNPAHIEVTILNGKQLKGGQESESRWWRLKLEIQSRASLMVGSIPFVGLATLLCVNWKSILKLCLELNQEKQVFFALSHLFHFRESLHRISRELLFSKIPFHRASPGSGSQSREEHGTMVITESWSGAYIINSQICSVQCMMSPWMYVFMYEPNDEELVEIKDGFRRLVGQKEISNTCLQ